MLANIVYGTMNNEQPPLWIFRGIPQFHHKLRPNEPNESTPTVTSMNTPYDWLHQVHHIEFAQK